MNVPRKEYQGDPYCQKCDLYLLSSEIDHQSNRHLECGSKIEIREREDDLPIWIIIIIIAALVGLLISIACSMAKGAQKRKDQAIIENYSPMSESPEIRAAYDRINDRSKIKKNARD